MKLLGAVVLILVLLFPAPARAQSVKAADIVGTWAFVGLLDSTGKPGKVNRDTAIFRPDSTFRWTFWGDTLSHKWRPWAFLENDTIALQGNTRPRRTAGSRYVLTRTGQYLVLKVGADERTETYRRVDPSKSKPVPARAQSVTVANVVGTWVRGPDSLMHVVGRQQKTWKRMPPDSLIIRADSTFSFRNQFDRDTTFTRWQSLRGDTITFSSLKGRASTYALAVNDRQLTLGYKRSPAGDPNGPGASWYGGTYQRAEVPKKVP